MRYVYEAGIVGDKKIPQWLVWIISILIFVGIIYGLATYFSPLLITMPLSSKPTPDTTLRKMQATRPANHHLYIPALNLDLAVTVGGDSAIALRSGAWQQGRNEPDGKENMVLCAQRFVIGMTPWETHNRSLFYNLGRLEKEDQVYLDYNSKRYVYSVDKVYILTSDSIQSAQGSVSGLTLFSCTIDGHAEKSASIIGAHQIGVIQ